MSEEEEVPGVSRAQTRKNLDAAKRKRWIVAGGSALVALVVVVVLAVVLWSDKGDEPVAVTTTTVSTTTTISPELATAVMPLTGVPVDGEDPEVAARLASPALAVKIDNSPQAHPQEGLRDADVVIEVMVEGISRYIAVYQSVVPDRIGPVRSARTSDPDLLAMFAKPVFAWSGGNKNVSKIIRSTPWIVNANHDTRAGDYSRERSRKAPHNLILRARDLLADTAQEGTPPTQLFTYLEQGQESPGEPVAGLDLPIASTAVSFRWDAESELWERQRRGSVDRDADDVPITAKNVLVLQTPYHPSIADSRSPEAQSVGEGTAWAFTQGRMIGGRWIRGSREQPWSLVTDDGTPIALSPGNTWVTLPDPSHGPEPIR